MLKDQIEQYYFANFQILKPVKQFHLLSRLWLWRREQRYYVMLSNHQAYLSEQFLHYKQLLEANPENLRHWNACLFKILCAKTIFNQDWSNDLDQDNLKYARNLVAELLANPNNLLTGSTQAANFIYLLKNVYAIDHTLELLDELDALTQDTELNNKRILRLWIYLVTHCVIGESAFYSQKIKKELWPRYLRLIKKCEQVIGENLNLVSLDMKFEFLVCCRILDYVSGLSEIITSEASKSFAEQGQYLIDKYNDYANRDNQNINTSEHRNVLYLMGQSLIFAGVD
jgi:hypothetical protein